MDDTTSPHGLFAQAVALRDAGHAWEASQAFLDFYQRFASSTDAAVRLKLAEAVVNVGVVYMRAGESAMAVAIFDKVVREHPEADESVAAALSNKGRVLTAEGSPDAALETYEELVRRFGEATDVWTMNCVAGALTNRGVILIQQGRLDEGLAALDELCRRFGGSADGDLLRHVAGALYNKGIALRDAGRLAEAVTTFTEAVKRFADSAAPEARRFAAMALYNRAITQGRLGDFQASAASAEEMVERFPDSDDPAIRERLSKALYNRALILNHAGMLPEAALAFGEIVAAFGDDHGAAVETVVAAARRRAIFMALLEPHSSVLSHNFIQSEIMEMEQAIREAAPERAAVLKQQLAEQHEFFDRLVKRNEETHRQAAPILARHLDEGAPFGLFLRSFEKEASIQLGAVEASPMWMMMQVAFENSAEKLVAEAFAGRVPILGVLNNAPLMTAYQHHLPKLELPNENWQVGVEELIRSAEIVIFNVSRLAPGVTQELDMLRRLEKELRTVVIISEINPATNLAPLFLDAPASSPQAEAGSAELAGFPLVFSESDFQERRAKDWPLFDAMLEQIEKSHRLGPEQREHWDKVVF